MKWNEKLKILRESKDKTQEDLAIELNVSRSLIARYESGKREPNIETIEKIIKYFDITYDYLLDDNEYDLERIRNLRNEICHINREDIPLNDVIFECLNKGIKKVEKENQIEEMINNFEYDNLDEIKERIDKINIHLIRYEESNSNEERIKAILRSLEIWGIYNEVKITENELKLLKEHIEFILMKSK